MSEKLLQNLGLDTSLDGPGRIRVTAGVHGEAFDSRFVAELIKRAFCSPMLCVHKSEAMRKAGQNFTLSDSS